MTFILYLDLLRRESTWHKETCVLLRGEEEKPDTAAKRVVERSRPKSPSGIIGRGLASF